jgi:L-amino acid N-acyltransferase YncA
MKVVDAKEADLDGILTIYNEVILNSTAVYAEEAVTLKERLNLVPCTNRPRLILFWWLSMRAVWWGLLHLEISEYRPVIGIPWSTQSMCVPMSGALGTGRQLLEAMLIRAFALGKHVIWLPVSMPITRCQSASTNGSGFKRWHICEKLGASSIGGLDLVFMQRFLF